MPEPSFTSDPRESSSTVFSPYVLTGVIATTLFASYWMVPSNEETARRLLSDGQVRRAAAVMRTQPTEEASAADTEKVSDSDTLHLLEAMLQTGSHSTDIDATRQKFTELLRSLKDLSPVPALIHRNEGDLDDKATASLYLSLADLALSRGANDEATAAYTQALRALPSDTSVVNNIIKAWRAQNKSERALAALEQWLKAQRDFKESPEMRLTHMTLLRENGRSGEALDLYLPGLHSPPSEDEVAMVEKLVGESSRTSDGIPVLAAFIGSDAQGSRLLDADLSVLPSSALSSKVRERATMLASFYEWQDEPSKAFTLHYKLALLGDHESLKRCIALYDGLDREADLCRLLQSIPAKKLKPTEEHLLSVLLMHTGATEEAMEHFRSYLASHKDDASAMGELASILAAQGSFDEAIQWLERALQHAPHTRSLMHDYGDLLITVGRARDALPIYEELSRDPKDDEALERFALVAEGLEAPAVLAEALTREINACGKPCPDLQIALTRVMRELNTPENEVSTYLAEAVKGSPELPCLRIELAKTIVETPRAEEAPALLARDEFAASSEAVELLCEAVQNGADTKVVAAFFKAHPHVSDLPIAPEYQDSRRQIIAGNGAQIVEATENAESPDREDAHEKLVKLREEAEASFRAGDHAAAYTKISHYFERTPFAHPADWNLLGHIYKSMGQLEKGRKAFAKSLESLTSARAAAASAQATTVLPAQ